jgi:hypothetical protein
MKKTASDGTVFGVFNQGNGDYVASEDAHGTHYAPPQYQTLPHWSDRERRRQLDEAVAAYEDELREGVL